MQQFIKTAFITLAIIAVSCNTRNDERNVLIGNWYSFDDGYDYIEHVFDAHEVTVFSHYMGNHGTQPYTYHNDSLNFVGWDYSTGVKFLSDTSMVLSIDTLSDTLIALPKDIFTYNKVPYRNDSLFAIFYREFELRARNARYLHAHIDWEDDDKSQIDWNEIEEEILFRGK